MTDETRQLPETVSHAVRDQVTGQYAFNNDFERLCKCGHSLGVHSSGGFYCDTDAIGNKEPEAIGCKCEKFRPSGKRMKRLVLALFAAVVLPAPFFYQGKQLYPYYCTKTWVCDYVTEGVYRAHCASRPCLPVK